MDGGRNRWLAEAGGRAVAVANAHPSVREAAPEVTSGHDVDGVARYLEAVLLGGRPMSDRVRDV